MQRKAELFTSDTFLQNQLHLLVNRATEDFAVPFHAHDFIEYCYVAEGRGFHHIEQDTFPVQKGMLFVIPVGVSHVFRPATTEAHGNRLIVYNCLFDGHMVDRLSVIVQEPRIREHLGRLGRSDSPYFSVFDDKGTIERLMLSLYREGSGYREGSATMLIALLSELIVTVYRTIIAPVDKSAAESSDFTAVIHYLDNNLSGTLTLAGLAEMSKWSVRHLQRMFRTHTGQPFGSYLQNLRIQKSCELLRTSKQKVQLIAESVGYRDMDSFNTVFKKITGVTPRQYRKTVQSAGRDPLNLL
ncbi:response regulator transcription factor [Paenibacillus ihuae]|uniref:response regulator transcription factor n=1 Tax=Paenibacillus ihuae TaxID=1232431 RepID=UPI0006D5873E|nr:response regulator transcription factor [Paenibacillus ihuae]